MFVPGGSSPRMRGTPAAHFTFAPDDRFIPAYAGNTRRRRNRPCRHSVHPRVCGEHSRLCLYAIIAVGSSPRMRGTHSKYTADAVNRRFIPAYAGNTRNRTRHDQPAAVHPRVCGEHFSAAVYSFCMTGSSPRMRGTHCFRYVSHSLFRFIPAYAGNTFRHVVNSPTGSVHPRVCGEHDSTLDQIDNRFGSSPRMRGTQIVGARIEFRHRFIPAYAGNTCDGRDASGR